MSSKSIVIILSYTVSKLVRLFETQCSMRQHNCVPVYIFQQNTSMTHVIALVAVCCWASRVFLLVSVCLYVCTVYDVCFYVCELFSAVLCSVIGLAGRSTSCSRPVRFLRLLVGCQLCGMFRGISRGACPSC